MKLELKIKRSIFDLIFNLIGIIGGIIGIIAFSNIVGKVVCGAFILLVGWDSVNFLRKKITTKVIEVESFSVIEEKKQEQNEEVQKM